MRAAKAATRPCSFSSQSPSLRLSTSMSRHPMPASLSLSALMTASFAANRAASRSAATPWPPCAYASSSSVKNRFLKALPNRSMDCAIWLIWTRSKPSRMSCGSLSDIDSATVWMSLTVQVSAQDQVATSIPRDDLLLTRIIVTARRKCKTAPHSRCPQQCLRPCLLKRAEAARDVIS
jgi:hypothetical protein